LGPRLQWLGIILLAALAVSYAAYESRMPGRCAFVHTGSCAEGAHSRAWYTTLWATSRP